MKKILFVLCLIILALTVVVSTVATATTKKVSESEIVAFVKENKNVEKAQVVLYANKCIVAVRPKEILTKTQYQEFKSTLAQEITEKFEGVEEVIVTFSPRAFKEIEKVGKLSEAERQAKIEEILTNLSKKPRHDTKPFEKPGKILPMPKKQNNA